MLANVRSCSRFFWALENPSKDLQRREYMTMSDFNADANVSLRRGADTTNAGRSAVPSTPSAAKLIDPVSVTHHGAVGHRLLEGS